MGANASTPGGGAQRDEYTGSGARAGTTTRIPDDLYELLEVDPAAEADEIRKAFRKQALKWHPDKNAGSEDASKRFVKIQAAYDVLSDDQERAYYDSHRGSIGADDQESDADFRERAKRAANSKTAIRLTSKQLMRFFDPSMWNGDVSDGPNGFYAIYRTLFETISQSEMYATAPHGEPALSTPEDYPSFGNSYTMYDATDGTLKRFYSAFLGFASRRPFNEVDKYRLQDAPDRRVKRLMEKENKRQRDEARKEYNETVRQLASFVKKRDPRFLSSTSSDPLRARQLEKQKLQNQLKEAAVEAAKMREATAKNYREQDWQRVRAGHISSDESEDDDEDDDDEEVNGEGREVDVGEVDGAEAADEIEDDLEMPDWYCAACEKEFASQGAWDNHERSKKHLKNVDRLVREMQDEDEEFGLSKATFEQQLSFHDLAAEEGQKKEDEEVFPKMSKKDKKKARRKGGPQQWDPAEDLEAKADEALNSVVEAQDPADAQEAPGSAVPLDDDDLPSEQPSVNGDDDSTGTPGAPQISKKDKRRAREAAKKLAAAAASGASTPAETCNVCQESFASRSKLFTHIKDTGHAAAEAPSGGASRKKGKRR